MNGVKCVQYSEGPIEKCSLLHSLIHNVDIPYNIYKYILCKHIIYNATYTIIQTGPLSDYRTNYRNFAFVYILVLEQNLNSDEHALL